MTSLASSRPALPAPLSKAKSSTFLSPDLPPTMYNSRVTLTLRRSHSRLQQLEGTAGAATESSPTTNGTAEGPRRLQRSGSLRTGHGGEERQEEEGERPKPPVAGTKPRLQHSVRAATHPTDPPAANLRPPHCPHLPCDH